MARVRQFLWDQTKETGIPYTDEDAVLYLRSRGVLPGTLTCSIGHSMILCTGAETFWECTKRWCHRRRAVSVGNCVIESRTSVISFVRFLRAWCVEPMSACGTASSLRLREDIVTRWRDRLREVCVKSAYLREAANSALKPKKKIGGFGMTVEVDESIFEKSAEFDKPKSSSSSASLPVESVSTAPKRLTWLIGGVCRESGETFLVEADDRSRATLLSAVAANVEPGSRLWLNPWCSVNRDGAKGAKTSAVAVDGSAYEKFFADSGFDGSLMYKDLEADECEGSAKIWGSRRWRAKEHWHTDRHYVESYLAEFIWLRGAQKALEELLDGIRESRLGMTMLPDFRPVGDEEEIGSEMDLALSSLPGSSLLSSLENMRPAKRSRPSRRQLSGFSTAGASGAEVDDSESSSEGEAVPPVITMRTDCMASFTELVSRIAPYIQPSLFGEHFFYCAICNVNRPLNKEGTKTVRYHIRSKLHVTHLGYLRSALHKRYHPEASRKDADSAAAGGSAGDGGGGGGDAAAAAEVKLKKIKKESQAEVSKTPTPTAAEARATGRTTERTLRSTAKGWTMDGGGGTSLGERTGDDGSDGHLKEADSAGFSEERNDSSERIEVDEDPGNAESNQKDHPPMEKSANAGETIAASAFTIKQEEPDVVDTDEPQGAVSSAESAVEIVRLSERRTAKPLITISSSRRRPSARKPKAVASGSGSVGTPSMIPADSRSSMTEMSAVGWKVTEDHRTSLIRQNSPLCSSSAPVVRLPLHSSDTSAAVTSAASQALGSGTSERLSTTRRNPADQTSERLSTTTRNPADQTSERLSTTTRNPADQSTSTQSKRTGASQQFFSALESPPTDELSSLHALAATALLTANKEEEDEKAVLRAKCKFYRRQIAFVDMLMEQIVERRKPKRFAVGKPQSKKAKLDGME